MKSNYFVLTVEGKAVTDIISGNHIETDNKDFADCFFHNGHFKQFLGKRIRLTYSVEVINKPRKGAVKDEK